MNTHSCGAVLAAMLLVAGPASAAEAEAKPATFGEDVKFLEQHTDAFVLGTGPSRIVVVPEYQGRVMTSTAAGDQGFSNGWINRKLIASGTFEKHINAFGGEDRFWLGPEGGQFAIFFAPGSEFTFDDWQTPAAIDTVPYELASRDDHSAVFQHEFDLTNKSGTKFRVGVDRTVRLLERSDAAGSVGSAVPEAVEMVAYETRNRVTNQGEEPWKKETGLLSIWILGMYNPSPGTTVVIPFKPGPEEHLGKMVNDVYFGRIPPDRLKVGEGILFFKADGQQRGKIGINPQRSKGLAGSYDADHRVLTVVTFTQPERHAGYVNSLWEEQKDPYSGDAVNSYNDGPLGPGKPPLGPFYELETSSPALPLGPKESYEHLHRTIHLTGSEADLDPIARRVFGVGLQEINDAL